jgi:hypothetical protein
MTLVGWIVLGLSGGLTVYTVRTYKQTARINADTAQILKELMK